MNYFQSTTDATTVTTNTNNAMMKSNSDFAKWLEKKIEANDKKEPTKDDTKADTKDDTKPVPDYKTPPKNIEEGKPKNSPRAKDKGELRAKPNPPTYHQAMLDLYREDLWRKISAIASASGKQRALYIKLSTQVKRGTRNPKLPRGVARNRAIASTSGNTRALYTIPEEPEPEEEEEKNKGTKTKATTNTNSA